MSAEETEEATFVLISHTTEVNEERAQHGDDVRQRFRIAYPRIDARTQAWESRRSGAEPGRRGGHFEYASRAQRFAAQRLHNEASCPSTPRLICRTLRVDPTIWGRPRRIPAVSKPLVIGVGGVCHELFLVVTAPSHGCKGVLYWPIPNRANALHEPTRDDSDENRLTRRIASRVSRNYKPVVERAMFVELRCCLEKWAGLSGIEVADDCLQDANTPPSSYIGPKGRIHSDQDLQTNGPRIWKLESSINGTFSFRHL